MFVFIKNRSQRNEKLLKPKLTDEFWDLYVLKIFQSFETSNDFSGKDEN